MLDALKEHVGPERVIDVELILSALDSLAAREEQVLSAFVDKGWVGEAYICSAREVRSAPEGAL